VTVRALVLRALVLRALVLRALPGLATRSRPRRCAADSPFPLRLWPEEAALWLGENRARRPRAARQALAALAAREARGRYAARAEGGGAVVTGPVSALALRDAEAAIQFVFRLTPDGYGEEPF
jgi:hypothetical protein